MPPYCGVPRLSHQFPVDVFVVVAVEATIATVDTVEVTAVEVIADVLEVVVGTVGVVDVLDLVEDEQDANTIEVAMSKVINNPVNPFFIFPPIIFRLVWKLITFRFETYQFLKVRPIIPLTPITPRAPVTGGASCTLS